MVLIIIYIDDDVEVREDFLEKVLFFFENWFEMVGIGGRILLKYEGNFFLWMNKYFFGFVIKVDFGDYGFIYIGKSYLVGCNMIY